MAKKPLIEALCRLSTCIVASAIETFRVRLPNTGYADSSIRCIFEDHPPIAGYAATVQIRSSSPPIEGRSFYAEGPGSYGQTAWWDYLLTVPPPRIVVIEDLDKPPGLGAFIGEVHANILLALGCVGLVTNGAVRDLPEVRSTGFQMFASNVSVSHAYAHLLDCGGTVEVGGLEIRTGDLIHGDQHGIQTIPLKISEKVPSVAREILQRRRQLIGLCSSTDFSLDKLREALKKPDLNSKSPK
jgi:4-hydroxy-4-methyl-2-oxoglutarate aldolase